MFEKLTKRIISGIVATVMAMSNISPIVPTGALDEDSDLTNQSIELYPNGEDAEQIVTLNGMMPEGAEAQAIDVTEEHDGILAYDITITDGDDEYQPGEEHPIFVEIIDPVIPESNSIQLWHIQDNGERERIFDFYYEEGRISFYATGFSVYEIVKDEFDFKIDCNIVPVTGDTSSFDTYTVNPVGENVSFTYDVVTDNQPYPDVRGTAIQVSSLDVLQTYIANGNGFYIQSIKNGFFAKNYQENNLKESNGSGRTGIAITASFNTADTVANVFNAYNAGAAKFYFEKTAPNENYYYIYTYGDESDTNTIKYVGHVSGKNRLYLTNDSNNTSQTAQTKWTVGYDTTNSCFYFKDANQEWYWNETYEQPKPNYGFSSYYDNSTKDIGARFQLWLYTPVDFSTDPYGLDGNTYGLVSYKDAANGNALMAGNYNNTGTQLGNIPIYRAVDNETSAVSYTSAYGITGWKFEWVEGTTKYKLSAVADDGEARKYLKVDSSGLSLVTDAAEASEITVIPDSNNRIQLSANGSKINCNGDTSFNVLASSTTVFDLVDISSAPADSLGLDGQTYALISKNSDTVGNAMIAKADSANAAQLDNQPIARNENTYIYSGELSGWTFTNVDTNRYIISNGSKYLKLVKDSLTLSDEPFILTVVAGDGDNAGKIRILNTTDRYQIKSNTNNNNYISFNWQNNITSTDSNRWLDLAELTTPPESDPFGLDGKTYGIMNKVNNTTAYSMTYDKRSDNQLRGKKADYVSDDQKYKSYGAPVGWTFHWQGYANYKLSFDTGGGIIKWLKFNSSGVSFVDESEATIFNVSAGTGDNAGKIRICPVLDNAISSIIRNGSGSDYYFQRGTASPNGQYWHDLISFNLNDPYKLNGKKFSLMHYISGANGHALTASDTGNSLNMMTCVVRPETGSNTKVLYAALDTDITEWTFECAGEDKYYIYADFGGLKKYLRINDDSIVTEETETPQVIQVRPDENGRIMLTSNGYSIKYQANPENQNENGRFVSASGDGDYLYFVMQTEIEDKQLIPYKAKEVSVSEVKNGEQVIIYTRVWNGSGYDFCAIDHNGNLVPCYERGDSIMWLSNKVNTMVWNFTECYYEYTDTPNHYYRLYNPYSEKYLVPKRSAETVLSDIPSNIDSVSINMEGRRYGEYYSTILAWDQQSYAYSGLKANVTGDLDGIGDTVVPSARAKADTFYFARVVDYTNDLTEVKTVDNTQHGITMRMVNFSDKNLNPDKHNEQDHVLGDYTVWENHQQEPKQNILSTDLKANGYPTSMNPDNKPNATEHTTHSLSELYQDTTFVNHLFIESILDQSGYYEYDSCQNYATLKNQVQSQTEEGKKLYVVIENGKEVVKEYGESDTVPNDAKPIYDFFVSKELGTHDSTSKSSLKHGQFFPYDDIDMDTYASVNGENLFDALQDPLKESDPRKYEKLHLIEDPDYYFGMQLDASFTQTPDGKDDWGHDIIFEFTGDDDFWLYVDGELVIDLGGIHSALGGNVNFATGAVSVNGVGRNLRDVFAGNYRARGMSDAAIIEELKKHFDYDHSKTDLKIEDFEKVFIDYTSHDMKIFYMERGAGASNLHMRFNLNYVTPGDVVMTKELTGSDDVDFELVEYPFQIWYCDDEDVNHNYNPNSVHLLKPDNEHINVKYQNSTRDVLYQEKYTPPGSTTEYESVYFINPHQSVEIHFPENTTFYQIKECGINSTVYDHVYVNGTEVTGTYTNASGSPLPERKIFESEWKRVSDRTNIVFTNHVNPDALRPLYFQKKLYDANYTFGMENAESHKITAEQDPTSFSFRLYLSNGLTNERTLANMVKYRVISPNGKYCKWNTSLGKFDESQYTSSSDENNVTSLKYALAQIANNTTLSSEEKAERKEELLEPITFETSINGQISEIRAWYTIEVPNIPVGVMFEVEERDAENERPLGYDRVKYERIEGTYLTVDGENDNVGIVRANDTPQMNVINQRGYEVKAKKVWSDVDFALAHDDIYTALYIKNDQGEYTLASADVNPVRVLSAPNTEIRYFMKTLASGKALSDYRIFEVTLTGDNISVDENGYVTGYEKDPTIVSNGGFAAIHATDRANSDTAESIVFSQLEYLDTAHAASWSNQYQFDNDVQLYGDDTTIKAKSIPNKLRGAEYLRTANNSAQYDGDLCRFVAGTAIEVYVAMDENITPVPEWLNGLNEQDKWEKTDDTIVTDSNTVLKLYKKNFTKGTTVTLGKNGGGATNNNYIVIAAPIYSYKTEYATGNEVNPVTIDGITYSARGDSITNIRQGGIVINLYEMGTRDEAHNEYGTPLQGGVFTLKKGDEVIGSYTSDASGRITIMYSFEVGQEYTLIQTSAPGRYFGVPKPITFSVGSGDEPAITVNGNDIKWNDYHKPYVTGDQLVAYIDVYNKPFELKAVKVDSEDKSIYLANVHFALYRGVNSVDGLIPDTTPIDGCDDLVTDSNGVIPDVTENLRDGTYFLRETQAVAGYKLFSRPIRFSIHEHDIVLFNDANGGSTITQTGQTPEGNTYEIISSNSGVQLIKTDGDSYDCVLRIPNEKDVSDYFFDIEKIIFVDRNVHSSDTEQKFVFKVDRFEKTETSFDDANIKKTFYVTLNCNKEVEYSYSDNAITEPKIKTYTSENTVTQTDYHYSLHTDEYMEHDFDAENRKVSVTYDNGTKYTYPAAIWEGRKTVRVMEDGIYRISEVKEWSSTDYDFWNGSNRYKGYGDGTKGEAVIVNGFRDSQTTGDYALPDTDQNCVYINVENVKASEFQTDSNTLDGRTVFRPTASFTNSETEFAYLSSQSWADNIIKHGKSS